MDHFVIVAQKSTDCWQASNRDCLNGHKQGEERLQVPPEEAEEEQDHNEEICDHKREVGRAFGVEYVRGCCSFIRHSHERDEVDCGFEEAGEIRHLIHQFLRLVSHSAPVDTGERYQIFWH